MKQFILFVVLASVILILTAIVVDRDNKIRKLNADLESQIYIKRTQEEWLRDCGFYGREE